MTLLERVRFWWSSILLHAKSKAPERDAQERPDPLAEMEREATDHILNDLAGLLRPAHAVLPLLRWGSGGRMTDDSLGEAVGHCHLWLSVLVTFVIGDAVTTIVGLQVGAHEANSVVAGALHQHGVVGILAIKAVFCTACYVVYRLLPSPINLGIPSGLATLGTIVTVWNLAVIGVTA